MIPNSFANHLFFLSMTGLTVLRPEALHKPYDAKRLIGLPFLQLRLSNAVISRPAPSLRTDALHDNDHHSKSPPHHAHKVLYLGHWYSNSCSAWRVVPQ